MLDNKNSLIMVEGVAGSGKTTLVNFLSRELNFPVYQKISSKNYLDDCFEYLAISRLYNTNVKLIQDRSFLSFVSYHSDYIPLLYDFASNLSKWKFAKIIFLYSDYDKILANIKSRGDIYDLNIETEKDIHVDILGMNKLLNLAVPDKLVLRYKVDEYTGNWKKEVLDKIILELE